MKTRIITIIIGAALLIGAGFFFINRSSEPATVAVTEQTIILDVRTPAEFAEGHLEGAELLDLNGGQLSAAISTMDQDAQYFVYCRSGNRSAQAVQVMKDAGFTDVTDLGSLDQAASATGLTKNRS